MDFNKIKEKLEEAGFVFTDKEINYLMNYPYGIWRVRYCRETFKLGIMDSSKIDKIIGH